MSRIDELLPFYGYEKNIGIHLKSFLNGKDFNFEFGVTGDLSLIKIPARSLAPESKDGLYRQTCFEVFIANEEGKYFEWNFSPSGDWCVFNFEKYRKKAKDLLDKKMFSSSVFEQKKDKLVLSVSMDYKEIESQLKSVQKIKIGASVVLEFKSGKKDYYALAHPSEKPDFHDPKGFLIDW